MKRRDFLKKSTVAVGLASSADLLSPLKAGESRTSDQILRSAGQALQETRSVEYLSRVQKEGFLPKPPKYAELPAEVKISPMSLEERIRRKVVPSPSEARLG